MCFQVKRLSTETFTRFLNTVIQKGHIKQIKSKSKEMYNVARRLSKSCSFEQWFILASLNFQIYLFFSPSSYSSYTFSLKFVYFYITFYISSMVL